MPTVYEICIEGQINACWSEWLDGMTITPLENGETLLTGLLQTRPHCTAC